MVTYERKHVRHIIFGLPGIEIFYLGVCARARARVCIFGRDLLHNLSIMLNYSKIYFNLDNCLFYIIFYNG